MADNDATEPKRISVEPTELSITFVNQTLGVSRTEGKRIPAPQLVTETLQQEVLRRYSIWKEKVQISPEDEKVIAQVLGVVESLPIEIPELQAVLWRIGDTEKNATENASQRLRQMPDIVFIRHLTFALYAHIFITADEVGEIAVERELLERPEEFDPERITADTFKRRAGRYTNPENGELQPVFLRTFGRDVLPRFQRLFGIDGGAERALLAEDIVNGQIYGLQLLKKLVVEKQAYTVEEVVQYLEETIGKFVELLGSLVISDKNERREFGRLLMRRKLSDDSLDMGIDVFSQPNVFIADGLERGTFKLMVDALNAAYHLNMGNVVPGPTYDWKKFYFEHAEQYINANLKARHTELTEAILETLYGKTAD